MTAHPKLSSIGATTPLSTATTSKPSYVSAYGTPTTFLNQRRGVTINVNESGSKSGQSSSSSPHPGGGGELSEVELEQCFKMQAAQTEMLHASVAELKQLEAKLKLFLSN